jgi:hypothetical protein
MLSAVLTVVLTVPPVASGLAASTGLRSHFLFVFISASRAYTLFHRLRREETGNTGKEATGRCRSSGSRLSNRYICRRKNGRLTVGRRHVSKDEDFWYESIG